MFRNTILSLMVLTLSMVTVGCSGGGTEGGEYYIGNPNGQHFGDDSWINDPIFVKPGTLAVFPLNGSPFVEAGADVVVAFRTTGNLIVGGVDVPAYQLATDGAVSRGSELIGHVVYTTDADGALRTAIVSILGDLLHLDITGAQPELVSSGLVPELAANDQAPRNELGLPVAQR